MSNWVFGTGPRQSGHGRKALSVAVLASTTALVAIPSAEAAPGVIDLQSPDGSYYFQRITGLSGDGRMFVGNVRDASDLFTAYFSQGGGFFSSVPGFGGGYSRAYGMSGDGKWVVGLSRGLNGYEQPYLWNTETDAILNLGLLYDGIPANSAAFDVSGDGTRVVGDYRRTGILRGFAWIKDATTGMADNEQMYELTGLDDANAWSATAISDNGRYAAGYSNGNATTEIAVRWDLSGLEAGGVGADVALNLGSLTDVAVGSSRALDISGDGRVVVGWSYDADGHKRAFRWVEGATGGVASNVQMYNLGVLDGASGSAESQANAVTRDGNAIVGWSTLSGDTEEVLAFRWSEETGMETISDWLERHGVDTSVAVSFVDATAVSDDGRVVAGLMNRPDYATTSFIARVSDEPGGGGSGVMDVAEYQATLYSAAGGVANAGEFLTWLPLNGAHHRPLMMTPDLSGDMCAWATGDFAQHGWSSTGLALAEAGACVDLMGGSLRIGGAVGTSSSWQDLSLGGSSRLSGQYVLSEVDWQPDGTPLLVSVTGMLGTWQADIDRAYSNGAGVAMSNGQTRATGGVVRVRADWLDAAQLGNTSINPYLSASLGHLHVDGYTESGGPFPASFNAQNMTHGEVRLGVAAITEFSTQTQLTTTFEVAHRSGTAAAAVGQVDGLFGFALGGGTYGQTWLRAGLELDHKISDQLSLSGSVHVASHGRDPSVALSAGIKGAF